MFPSCRTKTPIHKDVWPGGSLAFRFKLEGWWCHARLKAIPEIQQQMTPKRLGFVYDLWKKKQHPLKKKSSHLASEAFPKKKKVVFQPSNFQCYGSFREVIRKIFAFKLTQGQLEFTHTKTSIFLVHLSKTYCKYDYKYKIFISLGLPTLPPHCFLLCHARTWLFMPWTLKTLGLLQHESGWKL